MSTYSSAFARFYDRLIGRDQKIVDTTYSLISTYAPQKNRIKLLELACGTGNILLKMPKNYELFGLDIAPSMLEIAKQKLPSATFIKADMTSFSIPETFDIIVCIFDSINHVIDWKKWQSFFRHTAKHLGPDGVFIFDMNTPRRMATLATFKPYLEKLDDDTLAFIKINQQDTLYRGQFLIFEHLTTTPTVIEEYVDEIVFPVEKVKKALEKYFVVEAMIDPYREKVSAETGRVFFVCRKRKKNTSTK